MKFKKAFSSKLFTDHLENLQKIFHENAFLPTFFVITSFFNFLRHIRSIWKMKNNNIRRRKKRIQLL